MAGSLIDSAVSLVEVESVVEDDLVVEVDLIDEGSTEAEIGLTWAEEVSRDVDGARGELAATVVVLGKDSVEIGAVVSYL